MAESENEVRSVTWTASEFINHEKSAGWYLALAVVTLAIATIAFVMTKDKVSTGVIIVAGLLFGVYGSHKPRQLEYTLDQSGITIGGKRHGYQEFKSFSVMPENTIGGVTFMPLKRFAMPLTVYFAPPDAEKIMSILTARLPFEEHHGDAIDALMRRIRF